MCLFNSDMLVAYSYRNISRLTNVQNWQISAAVPQWSTLRTTVAVDDVVLCYGGSECFWHSELWLQLGDCSWPPTPMSDYASIFLLVLLQVLLMWGLQKGCAVIPKSIHPDYIAQYSPDQLLSHQLSQQHVIALDALEDGHKYCWDASGIL